MNLDKSYEISSSKYYPSNISHETSSKIWTAVLQGYYSLNSTFRLLNVSKTGPHYIAYRGFKSNLDKSYEVSSSRY